MFGVVLGMSKLTFCLVDSHFGGGLLGSTIGRPLCFSDSSSGSGRVKPYNHSPRTYVGNLELMRTRGIRLFN